ncbi:MAG: hypothetical protein WD066_00750 [Planctomycetaceae bacterium]
MPVPPSWLSHLADQVAQRLRAADILAPLGCHYYRNRVLDQWEVTIFAGSTEIVGGELDGELRYSNFQLDLRELFGLFDLVDTFHWQADQMGPDDELGPHVSVEGSFEGHPVWLRVLARPPARFPKGRNLLTDTLKLEDVW